MLILSLSWLKCRKFRYPLHRNGQVSRLVNLFFSIKLMPSDLQYRFRVVKNQLFVGYYKLTAFRAA
nr:odorant receptor [Semanotus bifasciatus]